MKITADKVKSYNIKNKRVPPAGGNGGSKFDSGCDPRGVTKIRIECGSFYWDGCDCKSTVKRVFLEFEKESKLEKVPPYHGYACDGSSHNKTYTFEVPSGDKIVKAVVWTAGRLANAVQFYTAGGTESPVYGIEKDGSKSVVFEGSQLVGVYGRFGGVIDSLGFRFASIPPVVGTPTVVVADAWLESESIMTDEYM